MSKKRNSLRSMSLKCADVLAVTLLVMAGPTAAPAFGQTAGMLSFQGLIKDNMGNPVNATVDLEFRIYDAEVGGSLVDMDGDGVLEDPGDDVTEVAALNVIDGILSTKFGPVHPNSFDGGERWLEVRVDDGEGPVALSRIEIATAPATAEQVNIPPTGVSAINIDTTGNVGIGTNTPTERLDVEGNIHASGTITSGTSITINGTADTITASSGTLRFGDQSLVTNVVIGTGTPASNVPLSILSNGPGQGAAAYLKATQGDAEIRLNADNGPSAISRIRFADTDVDLWAIGIPLTGANRDFRIYDWDAGETRLAIDAANGNVGIGTTNPGYKLDVDGGSSGFNLQGTDTNTAIVSPNGESLRLLSKKGIVIKANTDQASGADPEDIEFFGENGLRMIIKSPFGFVGIGTPNPSFPLHMVSGAHVTVGGAWTNASDRNAKRNLRSVDKQEVLHKVVELPITDWQYNSEPASVRHIGPMAQDFSAAFGMGENEKFITTIDADGVALAAIQGLYEIVKEKDAEITALRTEMDDRIASLEQKLAELAARGGR